MAATDRQQYARSMARVMTQARATYIVALAELLGVLSDQQRQVYEMTDKPITSTNVVAALGVTINHASGLLKELYQLNLLIRDEVVDEQGRRFIYQKLPR